MSEKNKKANDLTAGEWLVNLEIYSREMEKGGAFAVSAFSDLLDMLKGIDLPEVYKKMHEHENMFAVVSFLRDFSRNLAGNFGSGSTGFPLENGFDIYYDILKEMGKFIRASLFQKKGENKTATIQNIYVNYAKLLRATQDAIKQDLPKEKFATM